MSDPFLIRVGVLLALGVLLVALDCRKPKVDRNRWREYSVLLLCALLGVIVGVLVDSVTVRISPDYFLLGKGIEPGSGFRARVLWLGAEAGASAGVVGGAILLVLNRDARRTFRLLRLAAYPALGASLAGTVGGLLQHFSGLVSPHSVGEALGPLRSEKFTTVWVTHLAAYLGAAIGLVYAAIRTRKLPDDPSMGVSRNSR